MEDLSCKLDAAIKFLDVCPPSKKGIEQEPESFNVHDVCCALQVAQNVDLTLSSILVLRAFNRAIGYFFHCQEWHSICALFDPKAGATEGRPIAFHVLANLSEEAKQSCKLI